MGILSRLLGRSAPGGEAPATVQALITGARLVFEDLKDPRLAAFLRDGEDGTAAGVYVTIGKAMKNATIFRCVSLISQTIGRLPLHLYEAGDEVRKAEGHPLFDVLYAWPNDFQSAFDFRSLMQKNALCHGNAYARVVRGAGGRVLRMWPMAPEAVTPVLRDDMTLVYRFRRKAGDEIELQAADVFHLRGLTADGVSGMSLVLQAAEAIGLAVQADTAAAKIFKNGAMLGGNLKHPHKLSPDAFDRLKASLEEQYSGASNAGKWMVTEEGMEAKPFTTSAKDSQHLETRKHQVEELGRFFGVPRPLLMVDETSWGSGIEQLNIMFIQGGLAPWFTAWEQAISRTLLSPAERNRYYAKFNEGALLRGSMKDQAEYFAKALGSGGSPPWLTQNEVRAMSERGPKAGGDELQVPANLQRNLNDGPTQAA